MMTGGSETQRRLRGKPAYCDPDKAALPVSERLRALLAYLPLFERPGFVFAHQHKAQQRADGVIVMGYTELSPQVHRFMKDAYAHGWVTDFDWMEWCGSQEAHDLLQRPEVLACADLDQLSALLTLVLRRDRFIEGSLAADLESGLVTRILERAKVLAEARVETA